MRSREEIEKEMVQNLKNNDYLLDAKTALLLAPLAVIAEAALDNRALLTEIRDALKNPPVEIGGMGPVSISQAIEPPPHKDELFDEAKKLIGFLQAGVIITPKYIQEMFALEGISHARASALREALLEAGVLRKQEGTGRYLVV